MIQPFTIHVENTGDVTLTNVHVTDATVSLNTFTVTLANDRRSNQTFGSANITPPAGFQVTAASTTRPGWTATPDASGVVEVRSTSNAVAAGDSIVVSNGTNTETFTTTAAFAVSASTTSVSVTTLSANASYSTSSTVTDATERRVLRPGLLCWRAAARFLLLSSTLRICGPQIRL